MTAQATRDYLSFNGEVIPAEYMPDWNDGVELPEGDGSENVYGARTGVPIGAICLMGWDFCPEYVFRWWFKKWGVFQPSLPLRDLVVPDPGEIASELNGIPYEPATYARMPHGQFYWAMAHRITRNGSKRRFWDVLARRRPFFEGGALILIEQIGTVPPL